MGLHFSSYIGCGDIPYEEVLLDTELSMMRYDLRCVINTNSYWRRLDREVDDPQVNDLRMQRFDPFRLVSSGAMIARLHQLGWINEFMLKRNYWNTNEVWRHPCFYTPSTRSLVTPSRASCTDVDSKQCLIMGVEWLRHHCLQWCVAASSANKPAVQEL